MSTSRTVRLLGLLSGAFAIAFASPALAICSTQGLELMKNLNGSWHGRGAVTPIGGAAERISCRVSYAMQGSTEIKQRIACAGTDYKIEASSQVTCEGNLLEGSFEEKIANNTGIVKGSISGDRLNIEADGPSFKGHFNVFFSGEAHHSVTITQFDPAKGRQIPVATIQLSR